MKRALFLTITLAFSTALTAAEVVESIIVRVGDRIVTRSQYTARLQEGLAEIARVSPPEEVSKRQAAYRNGLLDELVNELLLKDRADRLNLSVSKDELTQAVERLKKQYGLESDEQFDKSLAESGLTREQMETRLRDSLLTNKLFGRELRGRHELSDRELRERYEREKERYRLPERAQLREIILLAPEGADSGALATLQARATEAAGRAARGEDFQKLVGEYSEAPTKDKGGDLGIVSRGELLPSLDTAVFNAPGSAVVGPIQTPAGFHVLKVEQRLPSEVPGFDSVKDRLRTEADEETFQRDYKAYVERLRKEAFIDIKKEQIPSV